MRFVRCIGHEMFPALYHIPYVQRTSRLQMLLRPLVLLPHAVVGLVYGIGARLIAAASWFSIVVTGVHPDSLWRILDGYLRFRARVRAYALALTDVYPPMTGSPGALHSLRVRHVRAERMSRMNAVLRWMLLLPHLLVSIVYGAGVFGVCVAMYPVTMLLGRMPRGFRSILERWFIYSERVAAYAFLVVDEFPPFHGLQPLAAERYFLIPHGTHVSAPVKPGQG